MKTHRTGALRALAALVLAGVLTLTLAAADPDRAVPWEDMTYVHGEAAPFTADIDALTAAADAGDGTAALALFDSLYDRLVEVFTAYTISSIRNSQDVEDTYWSQEMVYSSTLYNTLADALATAGHRVIGGPCGDAFAAHVGGTAADFYRDYEPLTERELALADRETALIAQYNAALSGLGTVQYETPGESWTLSRLQEQSYRLAAETYYHILYGIFDRFAQQVGPLFRELVDIRTEQAAINGYADSTHFIYEEVYARAYTPEQAQALFDQVKQISRDYQADLAASPVFHMPVESCFPWDSQEQMLDILGRYAGQVDPVFDRAWAFLTDNGLCDVAVGGRRAEGAFTTALPAYDSAFLYSDSVGSLDALCTLFHEFGHFTAFTLVPDPDLLAGTDVLDLAEIPSTGLELLAMRFFDDICGSDADTARFQTLDSALNTVITQSLYAEFEALIYAHPDMTVEEMGQAYDALRAQYGLSSAGQPDQTWLAIPHFFQAPGYMVSYVAAALASLQIWAAAEEDWQTGVDIYMDILGQGCYDRDYFQVLDQAGLKSFRDPGVTETVCGQVMDALTQMEQDIYQRWAAA